MKKRHEYTRGTILVEEVTVIFRAADSVAYSLYKDDKGMYYLDAYDAAPTIVDFGEFANDNEAITRAQEYIDAEA